MRMSGRYIVHEDIEQPGRNLTESLPLGDGSPLQPLWASVTCIRLQLLIVQPPASHIASKFED
jgi:hypothetical protein